MQTLLAILLYMQLISSPGTYTDAHIQQLELSNQSEILQIQTNQPLMDSINAIYLPQTHHIIIISTEETKLDINSCDFWCEKYNKLGALTN